jgi:alpha-tubulin suppressor-like RCC1 family protein
MLAGLTMATAAPAQAAPYTATAWGHNNEGQLGDGTTEGPEKCGTGAQACSTTPIAVKELAGVKALSAGKEHSLALLEGGTVMAWGRNNEGQLGDGSAERSADPVAVSGLSSVSALSAGANHGIALLASGSVVGWGSNDFGQLGDGSTENSDVPVAVSGLSGVVAIAAGERHSLALLSDGSVVAWGSNVEGQLGDGGTESSDVPVAVSGLSGVVAISAGSSDSLALLSNGTVKAWGADGSGQLGNGGVANSDVPVTVSGLKGVRAISAGGSHSLARLSNGTVRAWGDNASGELGDGTSTGPEQCGQAPTTFACSKKPVAVNGLSGVRALDAGESHNLALLNGGSVVGWGRNDNGQLGGGSSSGPEHCEFGTPCSTTPVAVGTSGVEAGISAGGSHSLAFGPPAPLPTNLPELGRCVKVAPKTGAFEGAHCVTAAPGKGHYDWLAGPGALKKFAGGGGMSTLETRSKRTVTCTGIAFTGEYTGARTATVTVDFTGCATGATKQSCQSNPLKAGEIEDVAPLQGALGFIRRSTTPSVGLDLKAAPPSTSLFSFECGSPPDTIKGSVGGSVIAPMKAIDTMTPEFKIIYKESSGKQLPERFEGGLKDTLATTFSSGLESTTEQTGLATSVVITSEEALEIKAK